VVSYVWAVYSPVLFGDAKPTGKFQYRFRPGLYNRTRLVTHTPVKTDVSYRKHSSFRLWTTRREIGANPDSHQAPEHWLNIGCILLS
jgi:hypothetical protein